MVFLENLRDQKGHSEINWPLKTKYFWTWVKNQSNPLKKPPQNKFSWPRESKYAKVFWIGSLLRDNFVDGSYGLSRYRKWRD